MAVKQRMINNLKAAVEAILFSSGEPLEAARISKVLGITDAELDNALLSLKSRLEEDESGIKLIKLKDKYQLCSKSEYAEPIRDIMNLKKNSPLSPASMEVLSIVAYNQPVTKAFIEQIRGVDCSYIVGTLCNKGLIEEVGRLELPGRPLIYSTTPNFLRCFCLESLDDLPTPPKKEENNNATDDNSNADEINN